MENNLKNAYLNNGFVIFKSIFSSEEITGLRIEAARIFREEEQLERLDNKTIKTNVIFRFPALRKIFANKKLMNAVKSILGSDCLLLPDAGLHDSGLLGGWHRDTGTPESAGMIFHKDKDFHVVNVAIYLQDNHDVYAGGLDIVPGSHKVQVGWWEKQKSSNRKLKFILSHLDRRGLLPRFVLHKRIGAYKIPSQSGDVVLFHFQCDHRPSHPKSLPIPEEHRKYAIFLTFSKNNNLAAEYTRYFKGTSEYWRSFSYTYEYEKEMKDLGINLVNL